MIQLRGYQQRLKNEILDAWAGGEKNVLGVLPTSGGKTATFSDIILTRDVPSCAIAHRQELVSQISTALARNGIRHNIIGPPKVIKLCVNLHMEEMGKSYFHPGAHHAVAGVDTLIRRGKELSHWTPKVKLWVQDECFPSWVKVDGVPIKDIQVGDEVTAFDENKRCFVKKKVVRLFKNKAPEKFVRIITQRGRVLYCTEGHPIYTKRGWVDAAALNKLDEVLIHEVSYVRKRSSKEQSVNVFLPESGSRVLRDGVLEPIPCRGILENGVEDQQKICLGENEKQQPDEIRVEQGKNESHIEGDRARAETSWWKRKTSDQSRNETFRNVWAGRVRSSDKSFDGNDRCPNALSEALQNRLRERESYDSDRSRWSEPFFIDKEGTGPEKERFSYWSRLGSISILERGDIERVSQGLFDGYVYNIEVEDLHTYVANTVVVHNCHHVLRDNKWGKSVEMFPNADGLGVTATPCRADGRGLGRDWNGVFDVMVEGPRMRDLIDAGYMTDYRIFTPKSDYHRPNVIGASGDYTREGMRNAAKQSRIVGDVVAHYLRIAPGKLGVTFVSDLDTADEVAAQFNEAGVPAAVVSSKTSDEDRVGLLRKFKNRQLLQLVNVDLFGEGFDLPAIEVVSFARPTESLSLYIQQFGRVLRLMLAPHLYPQWEGLTPEQRKAHIAAGTKPHGIVIDHVGNIERHKLPDAVRLWSLESRSTRSSGTQDGIPPMWSCRNCSRAWEKIYTICKECGTPRPEPAARSGPEFVDGDLIELDAETLARMRQEVAVVDMDKELYRAHLAAKHVPHIGQLAQVKKHLERQEAQKSLRESLAWWGGFQRSQGRPDSESYRRFFFTFGVDVLTAQSLGTKDALELKQRVDSHLTGINRNAC